MMRAITTFIIALAFALVGAPGCTTNTGGGSGVVEQFAEQEPAGAASGIEAPDAQPADPAAAARRLSIDQLEGSLAVLAGSDDLEWTFVYNDSTYGGFSALGVTLGRPDYHQLTDENREPSALYIKLMGDMAADVCDKLIVADAGRPFEERTFLHFEDVGDTSEAVVLENLRYLKLFYLGEYVTDDAGVEGLRAVFEAAHAEAKADDASNLAAARDSWKAVCMALLSSPNFHVY
ncbi:MAG: hypothetical protein QF464_15720 [Myxococcota bacterium]|nr:hypothetical protein [Myxococcota bacterium]